MTSISLSTMIQPMPGLIAVQVDTKDEITPQGLLIPREVARSIHEGTRPTHGRIVVVGEAVLLPEEDDDDTDLGPSVHGPAGLLAVGDHVLFSKFSGTKISRSVPGPDAKNPKLGATEEVIVVMRASDVLAKILTPTEAGSIKVRS